MSAIPGRVYDLLSFEMINSIVGREWDAIVESQESDCLKKVETLGFSVGYRWAEIQKIQQPAWNNLSEVMKDICTHFWSEMFGEECESMHTDENNIFVLSCKTLRPLSKICRRESGKDRLNIYALFYKAMIEGIVSLSGFRASTSFRKNRNSGDFEFIVTAL